MGRKLIKTKSRAQSKHCTVRKFSKVKKITRPLLIFKVRPFGIERNGNKWSASLALILVDLLQNDHFLFFLSVLDPSGEIFPSKVMVSITGGQERAETDARGRYGDQPVCPVSESANSKSETRALSRFAPRVILPERAEKKGR